MNYCCCNIFTYLYSHYLVMCVNVWRDSITILHIDLCVFFKDCCTVFWQTSKSSQLDMLTFSIHIANINRCIQFPRMNGLTLNLQKPSSSLYNIFRKCLHPGGFGLTWLSVLNTTTWVSLAFVRYFDQICLKVLETEIWSTFLQDYRNFLKQVQGIFCYNGKLNGTWYWTMDIIVCLRCVQQLTTQYWSSQSFCLSPFLIPQLPHAARKGSFMHGFSPLICILAWLQQLHCNLFEIGR